MYCPPRYRMNSIKMGGCMRRKEMTGGATKTADQNWIALIAKTESVKVLYDDVLYIEQVGDNLNIYKDTDTIQIPGRISKISIGMGEQFFQCHSYLIINLSRVLAMTRGEILFDNLTSTHLGEKNYYKARKKFNRFLLGE